MCEFFDIVDVKSERVKFNVEFDVAKFVMKKRFDFSLIELKNNRDFVMMFKINFYFRIFDEMML